MVSTGVRMFREQWDRVVNNVVPFFYIGFFSAIFIAKADYLENIDWLNKYFTYANIDFSFKESAKNLFFEQLAPNSLLVFLILIYVMSAMHRIFRGAIEKPRSDKKGFIYTIENFASMLGIAWLGVMLGFMLPAWFFDGFNAFCRCLILAIYPAIFLIEVSVCCAFLHFEGVNKIPEYVDERWKWKIGTRLEGVVILFIAFVILTYHQQYESFLQNLGKGVISMLKAIHSL